MTLNPTDPRTMAHRSPSRAVHPRQLAGPVRKSTAPADARPRPDDETLNELEAQDPERWDGMS